MTSVVMDQWIIALFAMATDDICPTGEDCEDVIIKAIVNGEIDYAFVNRIYESIVRLQDGDDCAGLMLIPAYA